MGGMNIYRGTVSEEAFVLNEPVEHWMFAMAENAEESREKFDAKINVMNADERYKKVMHNKSPSTFKLTDIVLFAREDQVGVHYAR